MCAYVGGRGGSVGPGTPRLRARRVASDRRGGRRRSCCHGLGAEFESHDPLLVATLHWSLERHMCSGYAEFHHNSLHSEVNCFRFFFKKKYRGYIRSISGHFATIHSRARMFHLIQAHKQTSNYVALMALPKKALLSCTASSK
jgi:hypothetical protein